MTNRKSFLKIVCIDNSLRRDFLKKRENNNFAEKVKFERINDLVRKKLEREYYWKMLDLFLVEKMDDGFHKYELGSEEDLTPGELVYDAGADDAGNLFDFDDDL